METWRDNVGNIHGRVKSTNPGARTVIIGSHYDTVIDAGKFDGALGIIVGIAAVKALIVAKLAEQGVQLDVGTHLAGWCTWYANLACFRVHQMLLALSCVGKEGTSEQSPRHVCSTW